MSATPIRHLLAACWAAAMLALAPPALADSFTLGTGQTTLFAAKRTAPYLLVAIANQSASATVSCTADGTAAAIGAAGSWDIPPGGTRIWSAPVQALFIGPFICTASAAATPVTASAR